MCRSTRLDMDKKIMVRYAYLVVHFLYNMEFHQDCPFGMVFMEEPITPK